MALDQSALLEVLDALRIADAADRIKQAAETIYQALIDAELSAAIGAGPHERTASRTNKRNGARPRTISSEVSRICAESPRSGTGRWPTNGSRMCSSTPPTAKRGSITGWCPRRW